MTQQRPEDGLVRMPEHEFETKFGDFLWIRRLRPDDGCEGVAQF